MYAIIAAILVLGITYLLFKIKCFGSCDTEIIKPFFMAVLGLIPTLLILLLREEIFISWLKHIAWWFLLGTTFLVRSVDPYTSDILSTDRIGTAMYCMVLLFIITLIYALVMNRRLKND